MERPLLADIVAKVFLGGQTKFFRAADAFCERRRERPHRFIQNRPGTSVVALKNDTAAEKSKDQLSRDFPGRSIFDFCNSIGANRTPGILSPNWAWLVGDSSNVLVMDWIERASHSKR